MSPVFPHRVSSQTSCVKVSYQTENETVRYNNPSLRFLTDIWHPNIEKDGKVCISILHEPGDDRFGYEKASGELILNLNLDLSGFAFQSDGCPYIQQKPFSSPSSPCWRTLMTSLQPMLMLLRSGERTTKNLGRWIEETDKHDLYFVNLRLQFLSCLWIYFQEKSGSLCQKVSRGTIELMQSESHPIFLHDQQC